MYIIAIIVLLRSYPFMKRILQKEEEQNKHTEILDCLKLCTLFTFQIFAIYFVLTEVGNSIQLLEVAKIDTLLAIELYVAYFLAAALAWENVYILIFEVIKKVISKFKVNMSEKVNDLIMIFLFIVALIQTSIMYFI